MLRSSDAVRRLLGAAALSLLMPALALAAEEGGHGFSLKVHGFYLINFIVFVAILVYVAGPAIAKAVRDRAEKTAARLTAAREEAEIAGADADNARHKVAGMEGEKASIVGRMEQEGVTLESKIQLRAEQEVRKIQHLAELALENELARLDKQVRTEVALEALDRAEAQLKATWQTLPHDRYVSEFGEAVKGLPPLGQEKRA